MASTFSPRRLPPLDRILNLILVANHVVFRISVGDLATLLRMAYANGWEPAGTASALWIGPNGVPIEGYGDSGGEYLNGCGQIVVAEDARGIRSGLSRVLAHPAIRLSSWGRRTIEDFSYFLERGDFAIT